MKESRHHHCSFCNEAESDTRKVLPGPGRNVGICGDCVTFSRQQVLHGSIPTKQRDRECSFCGKLPPQVEKLAFGSGVNICSKCIDFAQQQLAGSGPAAGSAAGAPGRGLIACLRLLLRGGRAERTRTITV